VDVDRTGGGASAEYDAILTADYRWVGPDVNFLLPSEFVSNGFDVAAAYEQIESVLHRVGATIRWRFSLAGGDSVFANGRAEIETDDGEIVNLYAMPLMNMGDDRAAVAEADLFELSELLIAGSAYEPLGHQLWREAWNLRLTNPRSSLVIGVSAAEVGLKQLIARLVPPARWLVEELPSPPLTTMMKHYLAELPIRAPVPPSQRCPKPLRAALDRAVKERNNVIHGGKTPGLDLRGTLIAVREFLYLLDLYEGNPWAVAHLSSETTTAIGLTDRGK